MRLFRQLRGAIRAAYAAPAAAASLDVLLQLELRRELEALQRRVETATPGNPAAHGFKAYSQADEDGILQAIFDRIGPGDRRFVEIGCGNGLENNTHFLLLKKWHGVWVDGDPENIGSIREKLPQDSRLTVVEKMVDRDNAPGLLSAAGVSAAEGLDLLSVDIDGNDLEVTAACAAAWRPRAIIVEYNAKFPPPCDVGIGYDPSHAWDRDDYHGASLQAFVQRLGGTYRLVGCNLAGTNAFFVRTELAAGFGDYSPAQLFQPARFHLTALRSGHEPSLAFLARELSSAP